MYVIIAGCGRVGSGMARQLSAEGHDVVVIDEDPSSFRLLGPLFTGQRIVGAAIDWDAAPYNFDLHSVQWPIARYEREAHDFVCAQVASGERNHFTGPDEQCRVILEPLEDRAREHDRCGGHRNRIRADARFRAYALRDGEGGLHQPVEVGPRCADLVRLTIGRFELPENLGLAENQRIEAARDGEHVLDRRRIL